MIGIVTTSRADYSIYRPVLERFDADPRFELRLWVTGMHMSPEFGLTVGLIKRDKFQIADEIECLLSSDTEEGVASSMGLTTLRFASSLSKQKPDILLILGDRFEMFAAASAAVPLRIPLAHIHGGEETKGAIDNVFRHALTKLSHVHFVSTELARRRVIAMGEPSERVFRSGAPALDVIAAIEPLTIHELAGRFDLPDKPFILVTYHPETLRPETSIASLEMLWSVLSERSEPIVFTLANADAAGRDVNQRIKAIASAHSDRVRAVGTLGSLGYFSAMHHALAMVGNSSSGIIEAASLSLPVVNIGNRQRGRERSTNTIDAQPEKELIAQALSTALSSSFRKKTKRTENIYGDGRAAERIVEGVASFLGQGAPVAKSFVLSADDLTAER